jgi:transposase
MNLHPQGRVAANQARPNAGIDTAKQHLDLCCADLQCRLSNDAPGWDEAIAILKAQQVDLVVIEASGGYERGLVHALQGAGIEVARVNPRQAHDFAKSMGVLAKTDRVDARCLRDFADVLARHEQRAKYITAPHDKQRELLAALMTRRRQLVDMHVAESQRLEHADKRTLRVHPRRAQDAAATDRRHRAGHRPAP